MLVGFVGFGRGQANAFLGARIDVLDHLAVGGGQLIEFVDTIPDGLGLPLHVLFAGERIQFAPETFVSVWLQRLFAAGSSLSACGSGLVSGSGLGRLSGRGSILVSRLAGRRLTRRGRAGLLREGRQSEDNGQEQRYDESVLHFNFLRMGEHCWLHSSTPYGRVAFFLRPLTGELKASYLALPALR